MSVTRDTSADDAAALMRRSVEGENDPPLTLSGVDAAEIRSKLRDLDTLLARIESNTKIFRERERISAARAGLKRALAMMLIPTN